METTALHPFYTDKGWKEASDLTKGDKLLTQAGEELTVTDTVFAYTPQKTYNFEVADWHTYFVGALAWLVHNAGKCSIEAVKSIKSINQLNKLVKTGKLPKTITRFDKGKIFGELNHVHFKNGAALNIDGTWKHGSKVLTNKETKVLIENGWTLPK